MKILMVVSPSAGGLGASVDVLSASLKKHGISVDLVTSPGTAKHFGWEEAFTEAWPFRRAKILKLSVKSLWRLRKLIREDYDAVHAHGHQAAFLSRLAGLGIRHRRIVSVHTELGNLFGSKWLRKSLIRFELKNANPVAVVATQMKEDLESCGVRRVEIMPVTSPRVEDLRHAESLSQEMRRELRQELGIPASQNGEYLVLVPARIAPQKRLDIAVKTAGELPGFYRVALVGKGDEDDRKNLRALNLKGNAIFFDHQSNIADWIRSADIVLLTSETEGSPLAVQEALAAGTPVVSTPAGMVRQLILAQDKSLGEGRELLSGAIFPFQDYEAAAKAIREICENGFWEEYHKRALYAGRRLPTVADGVQYWKTIYSRASGI